LDGHLALFSCRSTFELAWEAGNDNELASEAGNNNDDDCCNDARCNNVMGQATQRVCCVLEVVQVSAAHAILAWGLWILRAKEEMALIPFWNGDCEVCEQKRKWPFLCENAASRFSLRPDWLSGTMS